MSAVARSLQLAGLVLIAVIGLSAEARAGGGGDNWGSCVGSCGGYGGGANIGGCYCDSACTQYGDCCSDKAAVCDGVAASITSAKTTSTGYAQGASCVQDNAAHNYVLVWDGLGSQRWEERLPYIGGYTTINAGIVQTRNSCVSDCGQSAKVYLDKCCTGLNSCYVLNWSNGGNCLTWALSQTSTNYNIYWAGESGSNIGGSELADQGLLTDWFGNSDCADDIGVGDIRNDWSLNENDTNGETIYHVGGYDGDFWTSGSLPGEDDGVVAYHSAAACTTSGSWDSLCSCAKYSNHVIAWSCGYDETHDEVHDKFLENLGW